MSVLFDRESGRLRLDRASFDALLAIAAGVDPPQEGFERVVAASVVEGSTIHPAVAPAVVAAEAPVARARLTMFNEVGRDVGGSIWVGTHSAGYLMSSGDDLYELIATGSAFFPASIARIVALGPRSHSAITPWRMPVDLLDRLVDTTESKRRLAADEITSIVDEPVTRGFVQGVVEGPWWYWSLQVEWPAAPGGDGGRSLHVLDTRQGMAILSLSDDMIAVDPIGPTDVFRLLTMILPRDDEVVFA